MMNHENLKGRVAVVTGGGGVLCSGFARDLAAQGCKVVVISLHENPVSSIPKELKGKKDLKIEV